MEAAPGVDELLVEAVREARDMQPPPEPGVLAELLRDSQQHALADVCELVGEAMAVSDPGDAGRRAWLDSLLGVVCGETSDSAIGALLQPLAGGGDELGLTAADIELLATGLREAGTESGSPPSTEPAPPPPASAGTPEPMPATHGPLQSPDPTFATAAVESLPAEVQELVDLLRMELSAAAELLETSLTSQDETDIELAIDELSRFSDASRAAGFEGLASSMEFAIGNLGLLGAGETDPALFRALAPAWDAYLRAPGEAGASRALAGLVGDPGWSLTLAAEEADQLLGELTQPDLSLDEADQQPARPTRASAEDVSLELPEDVETELLDSLLIELPRQTGEFSAHIQALFDTTSPAEVDAAGRVAHTVKGAANTVGVVGIANLTHHLEDILTAFAKAQAMPPRALVEVLLTAADCLEAMSESLADGSRPPEDAVEVLQSVLTWANRIDAEGLPDAQADTPAAAPPPVDTTETPPEPAPVAEEEAAAATVRVPATRIDELLSLTGEHIILDGQIREQLRGSLEQARTAQHLFAQMQQLSADLEHLIDVKDIFGRRLRSVGDSGFDPLEMDQYNELHTLSRRLIEAADDARELGRISESRLVAIDDMLTAQNRLDRTTQESVMQLRMVAVKAIEPRLQRSVRQAARMTGKQVALIMLGGDTLIDSDVLDHLIDALMHVLRNAVDHGIESADERAALDKPASGRIELEFGREGQQILVRCRDDGRGLNLARIRRKALDKGWIQADQDPDDAALRRLLFRPGFTTRDQATQVSGRGIGMDAVRSAVAGLGGFVDIDGTPGQGCEVSIRLPVSLISTHAILVASGNRTLAIANRGIEQILHLAPGTDAEPAPRLRHGDRELEPVALEALVDLPTGRRRERIRHAAPAVLLVQTETGIQAVRVQSVLDSRDLVIKSPGRYVPRIPGIAGATILGSGEVSAVLDLPELLRLPARRIDSGAPREAPVDEADLRFKALVVDDSLSARRALLRVLEDAGYAVRGARDGLEAVELMAGFQPDVVLVDMEMPRMNGLELTAHLRGHPQTARLPIVMITSRSTAKHRQQADAAGVDVYFTKPFSEDTLLDAVTDLLTGLPSRQVEA